MAKLSRSDVSHVAKLAKLDLTPAETDKFQKQLSEIVDYISELNEVDTSGIEPTSQTTGLENVTRVDVTDPSQALSDREALSGTDNTYNNFFKVPAVLDKSQGVS